MRLFNLFILIFIIVRLLSFVSGFAYIPSTVDEGNEYAIPTNASVLGFSMRFSHLLAI